LDRRSARGPPRSLEDGGATVLERQAFGNFSAAGVYFIRIEAAGIARSIRFIRFD